MKTYLLSIALLCLVSSAQSQSQFGIKTFAGYSYTNETSQELFNANDVTGLQIAYSSAELKKGIGLSFHTQNSKLFLTTDAAYVSSGKEFTLESTSLRRTRLDPEVTYANRVNSIRGAVTAGLTFKNFKFGVGPELSFTTSQTEEMSELDDITFDSRNYSSGFNFSIGYMFGNHIHVDLKHTSIFQDAGDGYKFVGEPLEFDTTEKYIELSLAFYL